MQGKKKYLSSKQAEILAYAFIMSDHGDISS